MTLEHQAIIIFLGLIVIAIGMGDDMRKLEPLSPDDAAARFARDPNSVVFPLGEFMAQFGLSEIELRTECMSGRLVAIGRRVQNGYKDVHFAGGDVVLWLANPETPQIFKDRFDAIGKERARQ